jgi:predicted PurR-regulated permease PerM
MDRTDRLRRNELLLAVLFAGCLYLVWLLRHVLLLIYVAVLFAVIFMPAVHWIQRLRVHNWRPGRGTSVLLMCGAVLVVVTVLAIFMLPPIAQDLSDLARDLPTELQQVAFRLQQIPFGKKIADHVTPAHVSSYAQLLVGKILSAARGIASGLMNLLLVILLASYFVVDGPRSFRWALALVPQGQRERLRPTLMRGAERAQQWLMGQLLLMLVLGSCSTIVFAALHVRYFYALGLFAGVANFIPVVGPIATLVVAGVVAMLDSWMKLLGVVIFYLIYQQVENAYLSPKIMKSKVGIPGVALIAALAVGGELAGIAGALVAVPTAAIIATVLDEYVTSESQNASEA